jgi:hypothetical protein
MNSFNSRFRRPDMWRGSVPYAALVILAFAAQPLPCQAQINGVPSPVPIRLRQAARRGCKTLN